MESYIIILKDNLENITECVCSIIDYLGNEKCFSTYYNYYCKYNLKTRDISFTEYCPLSIHKKTSNIFQTPLIMSLAREAINSSFNKIEARLTLDQINYLKTLDCVEEIRRSPKIELASLSDKVGDNTKSSFVNYNPNTNFGLQAQNKDFENYTLGNTKIFNYLESPDNTTYKYNYEEINNQEIDIIVIDGGIHGNHQNFIIDGKNICKIDEQPNLPWQLSKLLTLAGKSFIPGSTPEGVSEEDPNFISYFSLPQKVNDEVILQYNHGTHVAGIICGANTGWIRSNKVSLYSIPIVLSYTLLFLYSLIVDLAILDFHINKIKNGIKTPTLVNRSYVLGRFKSDTLNNFSNFTKIYNEHWFYTYYDSSKELLFETNKSKPFNLSFIFEIQKKFGIVNIFAGGNDTELQVKWSEDTNDYFNYYLTNPPYLDIDYEYYTYPYIPRETCLREDLWTIGGLKLSELTYESFFEWKNGKIEINYSLIQTRLNNNLNNIYKILNEKPPTIIVGMVRILLVNTFNYLNKENVGFLSSYIISGYSAFGDALIYSLGSNIRSSVAYNSVNERSDNLYDKGYGTSAAAPNITGILALYLTKLYSTLDKSISIDKIMTDTNSYVQNYIDHNLRNVHENVDITQYPDRNEYFYKDIQLYYRLEFNKIIEINDIYPLSISPLYKIYCPVLFYNRDFITAPPIQPDTNELIAVSFKRSALVENPITITLKAKNTTSENYSFIITRYPKYGTITQVINSIVSYTSTSNTQDSFQYVVKEGQNTSSPGTVIIYNYNQNDIKNIPRELGTFTFSDILFDGKEWTFGTIRTDTFIEEIDFYRLGNYRLKD